MVRFELNGQQYSTPEGWHKITFAKFLTYLETIQNEMPKQLISLYESENMAKDWDDMDKRDKGKCYKYFAKSVGYWCGLDAKTIEQSMNLTELESAYFAIDVSLDLESVQIDENFTGFLIGNTEYLLPQKHMEGSTVLEFAEAAQFELNMSEVKNGNWFALLDVMAVICRPKGEVYEYQKQRHDIRKNLFKGLTMDIILNVSFFLFRLNDTLSNTLKIYSLLLHKAQIERKQSGKNTDGI